MVSLAALVVARGLYYVGLVERFSNEARLGYDV